MRNLHGFLVKRRLLTHAAVCALSTASISFASTTALAQQASPSASGQGSIETIVVTAEKRVERLQDTPVPVTVLNATSLVANNQLQLADYFTQVPGLNLEADGTTGVPSLSIRGISTGGQTNPSVGVTIDDVPFGASTYIGGGYVTPDIDPSDLSDIQVLRGPQGTLYGVSSLGGVLKYTTVAPSTDAFTGHFEAGLSSVDNASDVGHNFSGAVNVPVSDTLAVRVSAFTHFDPGYIDNIETGEKDVNSATTSGGMASVLWRPSTDLTVRLSALLEYKDLHGSPTVNIGPGYEALQQSTLRGTGGFTQQIQNYSATITKSFGEAEITSITGYGINSTNLSYDVTPIYGGFTQANYGVTGAPYFSPLKTKKLSEELRFSTPIGDDFELLAGGFFTHEDSVLISDILAENPVTGAYTTINPATGTDIGVPLYYNNPTSYTEYAVFADLTYHITDRFDVQVGGREAFISQKDRATTTGSLLGGATDITPQSHSYNNAFTYLFTPKFQISPDLMVYARLASGYRAGGPNANAEFIGAPPQYKPDQTYNYDLGLKGDLFGGAILVDASLYYIDWKNVQITVEAPSGSSVYIANGGKAESKGAEISLEAHPLSGMTAAGWVALNYANLTENLPAGSSAFGLSGDQLPYSSHVSANVSLDQAFLIAEGFDSHAGINVSYIGDRLGIFQATPVRQEFPAYAKIDLRAGVDHDNWALNFYVNNLTNDHAKLTGGLDSGYALRNAFVLVQPRTIGASLNLKF